MLIGPFSPNILSGHFPTRNWIPDIYTTCRSSEREVVESTNKAIAAMNKESKVNEGIRKDSKSGKTLHRHHTTRAIWRETEVRRMLHLTPEFKVKIAKRAGKILMGGLLNVGDWSKAASTSSTHHI